MDPCSLYRWFTRPWINTTKDISRNQPIKFSRDIGSANVQLQYLRCTVLLSCFYYLFALHFLSLRAKQGQTLFHADLCIPSTLTFPTQIKQVKQNLFSFLLSLHHTKLPTVQNYKIILITVINNDTFFHHSFTLQHSTPSSFDHDCLVCSPRSLWYGRLGYHYWNHILVFVNFVLGTSSSRSLGTSHALCRLLARTRSRHSQ